MSTKTNKTLKVEDSNNSVELTKNEREVLQAIVDNAKKVGDSGVEFILEDVAKKTGKSIKSVSATTGSLEKKGLVTCCNGESYFDGMVTEAGLKEASTKEETKEVDKGEQPKEKTAKTARKVGETHPNHPTWVWKEYAEGKFDWRINPTDNRQGQRKITKQ